MVSAHRQDKTDADDRFNTADRLANERYALIADCRELLDRRIPNARNQEEFKILVAEAQQKINRFAQTTDEYNNNRRKPLPPDEVDRKIEMNFASQLTNTVVGYLANNDTEFKRLYNDMNDGRTGAGVVAGEKIGRILKDEYNIEFEPPVTKMIAKK